VGGEDDVGDDDDDNDDDDDDDVNSIKRSVYRRLLSINNTSISTLGAAIDGCSQAKNMLLSNNKNIQVAS